MKNISYKLIVISLLALSSSLTFAKRLDEEATPAQVTTPTEPAIVLNMPALAARAAAPSTEPVATIPNPLAQQRLSTATGQRPRASLVRRQAIVLSPEQAAALRASVVAAPQNQNQ